VRRQAYSVTPGRAWLFIEYPRTLHSPYAQIMCRSIKTLRGAQPPADEDDIRAAALQFVRKVSGYRAPSPANRDAFDHAVDEVTATTIQLLTGLRPGARQNAEKSAPGHRDFSALVGSRLPAK